MITGDECLTEAAAVSPSENKRKTPDDNNSPSQSVRAPPQIVLQQASLAAVCVDSMEKSEKRRRVDSADSLSDEDPFDYSAYCDPVEQVKIYEEIANRQKLLLKQITESDTEIEEDYDEIDDIDNEMEIESTMADSDVSLIDDNDDVDLGDSEGLTSVALGSHAESLQESLPQSNYASSQAYQRRRGPYQQNDVHHPQSKPQQHRSSQHQWRSAVPRPPRRYCADRPMELFAELTPGLRACAQLDLDNRGILSAISAIERKSEICCIPAYAAIGSAQIPSTVYYRTLRHPGRDLPPPSLWWEKQLDEYVHQNIAAPYVAVSVVLMAHVGWRSSSRFRGYIDSLQVFDKFFRSETPYRPCPLDLMGMLFWAPRELAELAGSSARCDFTSLQKFHTERVVPIMRWLLSFSARYPDCQQSDLTDAILTNFDFFRFSLGVAVGRGLWCPEEGGKCFFLHSALLLGDNVEGPTVREVDEIDNFFRGIISAPCAPYASDLSNATAGKRRAMLGRVVLVPFLDTIQKRPKNPLCHLITHEVEAVIYYHAKRETWLKPLTDNDGGSATSSPLSGGSGGTLESIFVHEEEWAGMSDMCENDDEDNDVYHDVGQYQGSGYNVESYAPHFSLSTLQDFLPSTRLSTLFHLPTSFAVMAQPSYYIQQILLSTPETLHHGEVFYRSKFWPFRQELLHDYQYHHRYGPDWFESFERDLLDFPVDIIEDAVTAHLSIVGPTDTSPTIMFKGGRSNGALNATAGSEAPNTGGGSVGVAKGLRWKPGMLILPHMMRSPPSPPPSLSPSSNSSSSISTGFSRPRRRETERLRAVMGKGKEVAPFDVAAYERARSILIFQEFWPTDLSMLPEDCGLSHSETVIDDGRGIIMVKGTGFLSSEHLVTVVRVLLMTREQLDELEKRPLVVPFSFHDVVDEDNNRRRREFERDMQAILATGNTKNESFNHLGGPGVPGSVASSVSGDVAAVLIAIIDSRLSMYPTKYCDDLMLLEKWTATFNSMRRGEVEAERRRQERAWQDYSSRERHIRADIETKARHAKEEEKNIQVTATAAAAVMSSLSLAATPGGVTEEALTKAIPTKAVEESLLAPTNDGPGARLGAGKRADGDGGVSKREKGSEKIEEKDRCDQVMLEGAHSAVAEDCSQDGLGMESLASAAVAAEPIASTFEPGQLKDDHHFSDPTSDNEHVGPNNEMELLECDGQPAQFCDRAGQEKRSILQSKPDPSQLSRPSSQGASFVETQSQNRETEQIYNEDWVTINRLLALRLRIAEKRMLFRARDTLSDYLMQEGKMLGVI